MNGLFRGPVRTWDERESVYVCVCVCLFVCVSNTLGGGQEQEYYGTHCETRGTLKTAACRSLQQ